jgi:hypothetical protein
MAKKKLRIPRRTVFVNLLNSLISSLKMQAENPRTVAALNSNMNLRRVLGFPLPTWQRQPTWSNEQMARFITSVYRGVHLGIFVYNQSISKPHLNGLLVDGQQRLMAIETYLANELAVAGEDGVERTWNDLTDEEQRNFTRMSFGFSIVECDDEQELVELYKMMAYGGTPHAEDERASLP